MYITEYYTINKEAKIAIRGVLMYREKRDLAEKREEKVLVIFVCYKAFPKRSQRKKIWRKLCRREIKFIHVEPALYYLEQEFWLGENERSVFGYEVRELRKRLSPDQKRIFDSFYYEK